MKLRCVIFDLDNTLVDSDLDFVRIKEEMGITGPILEYRAAAGEEERRRIDEILERHEDAAATSCGLREGARELMKFLKKNDVRTALLTRNSRRSVDIVLRRHGLRFDRIVSREDSVPKPSPEPVRLICRALEVPTAETLVVGDFLYDIQAGRAAGCVTMLVDGPNRHRFTAEPDYEVASLHEALSIVEGLMKGRADA
jgi:HAD superfamily hydrolase (TIGR01549 family)